MKKQRIVKLFGIAIVAILLAGCAATESGAEQDLAANITNEPTVKTEQDKPVVTSTPTEAATPTPEITAPEEVTLTITSAPVPTAEPTETPTPEPTPQVVDKTEVLLSTFVDTGDSELNDMCDEILKEIINIDMTEREKAYAIYQWVNQNVKYRGTSDTSDWVAGSKYALAYKKGNCYAFYAASRGLLTRAGFENVEATEYNFTHYWNIVKVDGVWRHFDATTGWGTERFLWTGTQILEYSYYSEGYGRNIIYEWNPEGCPDTD